MRGQLLMMTDGVSKLGYTGLLFVDPGLKVYENYYCDLLLSQQLLAVGYRKSLAISYFGKTIGSSVQRML